MKIKKIQPLSLAMLLTMTQSGYAESLDLTEGETLPKVTVEADADDLSTNETGYAWKIPVSTVTQKTEAAPASTTIIDYNQLNRLSISTYGDMFRNVPGVFVNDYGQGLVSYEIKMRGFASGHSSDINFMIDGVPMNISGSSHKNGYVDLNPLIPETLSSLEITRGPFSTAFGNHDVAGSVNFSTFRDMRSMFKMDIDNFGRTRILPVFSEDVGEGRLLVASDLTKGSGYTDKSEIEKANFFARYSQPLGDGIASLRLQHYMAKAEAPGYLNFNRIKDGLIRDDSALNDGNGDAKNFSNIVLNYKSNDIDGASPNWWDSGWTGSIYAVRDLRQRWFNYNSNLPVGDNNFALETEHDDMQQFGYNFKKATMLSDDVQVALGSQYNYEMVDAQIFDSDPQRNFQPGNTVWGARRSTTQTSSFFGEVLWSPVKSLKIQTGLRWDMINFATKLSPTDQNFNGPAGNNFDNTKDQFSPKFGIGWTILDGDHPVELFANAARGLKSPYVFGNYNGISNADISSVLSYEVGFRGGNQKANWRLSGWRTKQDSETILDGVGRPISSQETTRDGFDLEGRVMLTDTIGMNANFSKVFAEIDNEPVNNHILSVPEWTAGVGFDGTFTTQLGAGEWSVYDTIIGPQPLFANNRQQTHTYHRVVGRVAFSPAVLKNFKLAINTTYYSDQFQEQQFDTGQINGIQQFGGTVQPDWRVMFSGQYTF
jgi:outer membrane receptor protein involved in Fe transport